VDIARDLWFPAGACAKSAEQKKGVGGARDHAAPFEPRLKQTFFPEVTLTRLRKKSVKY